MSPSPFKPDIEYERSGLKFRVRRGRKGPQDQVLEWHTPHGWQLIRLDDVAFIVEFLYRNEDRLYPRANGFQGGEKFLKYLTQAAREGYSAAAESLAEEKAVKAQRNYVEPRPFEEAML